MEWCVEFLVIHGPIEAFVEALQQG
jgi:hypothetical protein